MGQLTSELGTGQLRYFPLPPLDCKYDTAEEAIEAINDFASDHGYAVTTLRSRTTKKGVKKHVQLKCDRGGIFKPKGRDIRKTNTIATGCPFDITVRRLQDDGQWAFTVTNSMHNHEPSDATTHVALRQQELRQKADSIYGMLKLGLSTRHILIKLRTDDKKSCLLQRDLNNARAKANREFLAGRTPLQALLMELPTEGWIFKYELDDDDHVSILFALHQTGVEMLRHHSWVLSMDCTYKTNQYGLPLLDIVGFTATGHSIYLVFAFIRDEKQSTYEVVLQCLAETYDQLGLQYPRTILTDKEEALISAINQVFPDANTIICIWHVNMNLMKKALPILKQQIADARRDGLTTLDGVTLPPTSRSTKKQLDEALKQVLDEGWAKMMHRWNHLIYANTAKDFDTAWQHFKDHYKEPIFTPLLDYIESEWLDGCPEHFLRYHTRHYLHLGEAATSRTEGSH